VNEGCVALSRFWEATRLQEKQIILEPSHVGQADHEAQAGKPGGAAAGARNPLHT